MSITLILVALIALTSYLCFNNAALFGKLLFSPYQIAVRKQYYRFISSIAVHADYMHLGINLLVFWSFGMVLEQYFVIWFGGNYQIAYILLFVLSGVLADVKTYFQYAQSPHYFSVGASGAVSGIVFACILINPLSNIYLFFILPLPSVLFGVLYLWYSHRMSKKQGDNINHDAHFYGAVAGILIMIVMRPSLAAEFINKIVSFFN